MKSHSKSLFNLLTLFALLVSLPGNAGSVIPVSAASPAGLATGLTPADWSQIEALLPPTQQAYIKASNTGTNDWFGTSIALSGNTLVVGAPYEDSNATGVNGNQADNSAVDSGAVYVFTRSGTTWSQLAYLKASNVQAGDAFGSSVTISGDTLVVGAIAEASNTTGVNGNQTNNSFPASGAAYVFTRSGTTWSQQAYLKASNTSVDDLFGSSVAISGDTLVVGAKGEGSNATGVNGNPTSYNAYSSGAAYVFTRSGTTWSQQAYLKASNTEAYDFFGGSVAISGDTLVVGSTAENSNATGVNGRQVNNTTDYAGAAYVFTRSGTTWSQQAYLKASNTGTYDEFGSSVAISGDTLVVGAKGEDSNATGVNGKQTNNSANSSGAAYVFTRSGKTWSQQAYLKASNTGTYDSFGGSVAISGDTLVVGAIAEDSNSTGVNGDGTNSSAIESGAAYVFTRSGTTWSQQAFLKASNTRASNWFGNSVTISGDTLVVGALYEDSNAIGVNGRGADNSANGSGAAYVFQMDTVPAVTSITRASVNPTSASSVDFTATFSKPVTGVDVSDFSLIPTGGGPSCAVTGISGSSDSYTVTISTGSSSGFPRADGSLPRQGFQSAVINTHF